MDSCRVCNADVAISAKSCPHCGATDPSLGKVAYPIFKFLLAIRNLVLIVLLIFVVLLLILF